MFIEFDNIMVLLCTTDTLSLIGNFVSLVIVSQFDDFVYASMKDDPSKILIQAEFTE
jgi:hypothetical protein